MKPIVADVKLVAYCGLYCGACGAYRKGRCPGCHENARASWCKVRACCQGQGYGSCAECAEHAEPKACRWFNNWIAKLFGLIFRSDRAACIHQIREVGLEGHAQRMAEAQRQSLPR